VPPGVANETCRKSAPLRGAGAVPASGGRAYFASGTTPGASAARRAPSSSSPGATTTTA